MKKYLPYLGFIKYVISLILLIIAMSGNERKWYIVAGVELLAIMLFSNGIRQNKLRYAVNGILCLLYNIQIAVYLFGRSWVTLLMLTNLESFDELSGQAAIYIGAVILVLVISFIPVKQIHLPVFHSSVYLNVVLTFELLCAFHFGNAYSPMFAYADIFFQYREQQYYKAVIAASRASAADFYRDGIAQYIDKPDSLSSNSNVVVIFTEGLSQSVVDDERGLATNIASYEQKSLNFTNYYNHTFATYRGLVGQLNSGHQFNNDDVNKLTSFQELLHNRGYDTTFINAEPYSEIYTDYVENLGFDQVIGYDEPEYRGADNSISDQDIYELLWDTMEEKQKSHSPYMITVYTLGTHASLDSPDLKFEDGKMAELNKFYNMDHWFGEFMKKFEESSISDNTLLVFTSDHCAYADNYFQEAFPDVYRKYTVLEEIPFFLYHKGIEPQSLDVKGRNSLDMVPTVCDYLDINEGNYFWGQSLFGNDETEDYYDTVFYDPDAILTSDNGVLDVISEERAVGFRDKFLRYISVAGE